MSSRSAVILVVDDLPEQRLTIEAALGDLGEPVVSLPSGADALKYLLDHDVAVILLDVNMPEMDGFETAALIRRRPRTASTPIIFLTADHDAMQALRGYALGAVDYITSPFLPDVLRTKVGVFVALTHARERIREEADRRLALQQEQVARAAAEEKQRLMGLMSDAAVVLAGPLDRASFEDELLSVLVPALGDEAIISYGGDPEEVRLWSRSSGEPDPGASAELEALGRVALTRARIVTAGADAAQHPLQMAFPLTLYDRTTAVLAVARRRGPGYPSEEREVVRIIASRAAVALDNRRLYQELQERDRRKDEFLAMLSHELRNPLGAITAATQLLTMLDLGDERAVRACQVVSRQSAYLARMIDDLLDVSRVTTGRITLAPAVLDLRELTTGTIESLRSSGRLDRHTVMVTGDPVCVRADAARMEQVLTNLLVNAVKYTDPGGQIQIEVESREDRAILRVIDDGVGIGPELLRTMFDLFVQGGQTLDRGQGGLGVGLTLVRRLVELQGGSVRAHSDGLGKGSTFVIEMPLIDESPAAARPVPSTGVPGRTLSVLIVDDNQDARQMLRGIIEIHHHEVHEATTGPEAVTRALAVTPDIALVDLGLPGFDGLEVARRLRADARTRQVMLVALTGYGQPDDRERTADAGFELHLVKPVTQERLLSILSSASRASRRDLLPEANVQEGKSAAGVMLGPTESV
jgi:CheY-like chemotaxis protein